MNHRINTIFRKTKRNGQILSYRDTSSSLEATDFRCSSFIEKPKVLVKGEYGNPKPGQRKAMILFIDPDSGSIKGGLLFLVDLQAGALLPTRTTSGRSITSSLKTSCLSWPRETRLVSTSFGSRTWSVCWIRVSIPFLRE